MYTNDIKALVAAVRSYALANYSKGGWDEVVEAWDDEEIEKVIAGSRSEAGAIRKMAKIVKVRHASGIGVRVALEKATSAGANLFMANLAGADLAGADLAGANLAGADLDVANLTGANLDGANLAWADLDVANLFMANLAGADLAGADLARANLFMANLTGANLTGANLDGANLTGANLTGANLAGANLARANLDGANLDGADLAGAKLIGKRPILQIGPIGSRCAYLVTYLTDKGVMVRAGCFYGTLDEFRAAVAKTLGDSEHGREYEAAMLMIEAHAVIWTPKVVRRDSPTNLKGNTMAENWTPTVRTPERRFRAVSGEYVIRPAHDVKVEVVINWDQLAAFLAARVSRSKGGRIVALGGIIKAKMLNERPACVPVTKAV